MFLALWLLIFLALTYAIGRLYEVTTGWKTVRLVFYPGMLVAALGRFAACLLGSQKTGEVDVMRAEGPSHQSSDKLPGGWWFRFLYAVGPFAMSLAAFVLVWGLLDRPLDRPILGVPNLPQLDLDVKAVEQGAQGARVSFEHVWEQLKAQKLGNWQMWVFLYVGCALIVAPAPSRSDLVSVGVFCGVLGLVVFVLTRLDVQVVANGVYGGTFWKGLSFMVGLALLLLAATVVILLPLRFILGKDRDRR